MRRIFAALAALAAVPQLSEAQTLTLFLEYEGTVEAVEPSPYWSYEPGDRVKGVVKIHPLLAPPDRRPATFAGDYVTGGTTNDFVVSKLVRGSRITDALHVNVGPLGLADRYTASDIGDMERGNPATDHRNFTIQVTRAGLVQDDGIVQSFDAIPKKDGSLIISALIQGVGEFRRTVTFALSRVSLTPGMCRA